jgi:hypothetical protein
MPVISVPLDLPSPLRICAVLVHIARLVQMARLLAQSDIFAIPLVWACHIRAPLAPSADLHH